MGDGAQLRIAVDQGKRLLPCKEDEIPVLDEVRNPEFRETALPDAEELARSAQAEINFCYLEPIRRLHHRLQPGLRIDFFFLHLTGLKPFPVFVEPTVVPDQDAIRLIRSTAYPAPQLMQL